MPGGAWPPPCQCSAHDEELLLLLAGPAAPALQVRDLLRNRGHNSAMMAYGITAAGKTYTIEGTREQPGVMPRALLMLFEGLASHAEPIVARASYYEVGAIRKAGGPASV